jgi:hypothetical protein
MKKISLLLLLLFLGISIDAQKAPKKITITGRVTAEYNSPVQDALIMIDGKASSETTNKDGLYKVRVKPGTLMIGVFVTDGGVKEEPVNGRTVINFNYEKSPQFKSEEASDREIAEAMNEAKHVKYANFSNIYEVLKTIQGVTVSGTQVFIRGIGSINDTTPLFVVDGVIVSSIADISPSNIKSIELMKGSDAAVYGVRGGNGVILIKLTGADKK